MRTSLLLGGTAALSLLALGAAACAAPAGSVRTLNAPGSAGVVAPAVSPRSAVPADRAAQSGPARWPGARLTSLALASPQLGYGLFAASSGPRCAAVSGRTSDGGARFRSASVITTWNCDNDAPVQWIAADGMGDALAYGPRLFVLRAGGDGSWQRIREPGTVLAVSASGRSVWLLVARCHGAAMTADGCDLRLMESADGGRDWHRSPSPPPGAATSGSDAGPADEPAAGQTWLLRAGASAGYVLASPVVNNRGEADSAALWYTPDSGASWSRRSVPCRTDALSVAVARAPGGALVAVCAAEPSAGFQVKTTAVSVDGGREWTVHTGCGTRPSCRDPLYAGYLGQVAAVSASTAFLAGSRSSLLVTTDGGRRWRPVSPAIGDDSGGTYQVTFLGRSDGVAIGQGAATDEDDDVFRTVDSGRTWVKVIPAGS